MNNFLPPMFTRIYISMILSLFTSVGFTLFLTTEYLSNDELVDFHRDTKYVFNTIKNQLEQDSVSFESYFEDSKNPMPYQHFDVKWVPKLDEDNLEHLTYLSNVKGIDIFEKDSETLFAIYEIGIENGFLLISDRPPLKLSEEALSTTPIYKDPEVLVPLLVCSVILIVIGVLLYYPTYQLQKQIENLTLVQKKFGKGELSVRANENIPKPLSKLAFYFNEMAEEISGSFTRSQIFAQAVPHEVRTPLSKIQLAVGIIRKGKIDKDTKELLDDIDRYIDDLTDLSDKVVLLSKLNNLSKCQKNNKEACNVIALVKERLNFLDNCDKKVKVQSDDEITLFCSPILLRLALDNLISNAIRYSCDHVHVEVTTKGGFIRITIKNDGPPIEDNKREELFMPFSRLDDSRASKSGGFGLGLAIAKSAANSMEGTLSLVKSDALETAFELNIPVK
ncbi:HAMP domain-containing sensor histidine kinase [Vibrio parahaemolyticus]